MGDTPGSDGERSERGDGRVERKLRELVHSWGISRFSKEMAWQWLIKHVANDDLATRHEIDRVRKWVLLQLNQQRRPADVSPWQFGCPELIPLLRPQPVWDCALFPMVQELQTAFPIIRKELLALKGQSGFQPYRAPSWASDINAVDGLGSLGHDAGDWNVFYLFLHNMSFEQNRALCPVTTSLIESFSGQYDHAFFSALAPATHIKKHHGPTNKKLRCHLPLVVPKQMCRLRVGDEVITVEEGKCFVFDDSFEHEAWNDDTHHARIVLIVDIWHPDFSPPEQKFLKFLRNAELRRDRKQVAESTPDNFFSIIEQANHSNMSRQESIWS